MTEIIKVKYINENCTLERHGDWIDLKASKDVGIPVGSYAQIPLGVAMKLPDGYEAHIVPRSSTFRKYGIIQTNGVGIVDNAYCGDSDEWQMPVYATHDVVISAGTRIAQFRIVPVMDEVSIVPTQTLNEKSRGGFGSSGD